ncbi:MAG TPA: D-alanyl-D-alanine carboxypeptidase family protein [Bacillota bacterium]|nr:D-alanyl-D-alanine carboxypeptidase family protein [Bacillota bacterium]
MITFPKILLCLLGLALMVVNPVAVTAAAKPVAALNLDAEAAFLIEPTTGEVLFQKNATRRMPPASVTKLMVMLLALEAIDRGDIKLSDMVTASPEACKMGGSQIWLEPGEQMTVAELLKAVCIVSANDASYALGEHIAGSEESFIALMNKRAKQLGLLNTNYVNTTGLEPSGGGEGNLTTAADMASLAREVVKYPTVFQWSSVWIDSLRGGKSFLRNTNKLVRFYRGCDGLKTGFTGEAGYCLVATAKREGVRLIAVAMKASTIDARSKDVSAMFNYGFSKFKAETIYQGGESLGQVRVFRGRDKYVTVKVPAPLAAIIKRDATGKIQKTVRMEKVLQAPVAAGQKIGEVTLSFQGKPCGRVDLVAAQEVKRASLFEIWKELFRNIIRVGVNKKQA